jgi:hypothetical protein
VRVRSDDPLRGGAPIDLRERKAMGDIGLDAEQKGVRL